MVVDHYVDGRSLRLQTATTTRLSSGWSWRMAQVVPPHYDNPTPPSDIFTPLLDIPIPLVGSVLAEAHFSIFHRRRGCLLSRAIWRLTQLGPIGRALPNSDFRHARRHGRRYI